MENKKPEENKMEIEISKYKNLVDALGDPVRVARMVLLIAAVTVLVAIGIIAIVCGIKRFYPYKSINSNPYGATFIQDEDNEIIYWLFNTADLWANSGIEVEEGDIISVRTSGAFHTAIHHLVEDANNNTILRDPWILSSGRGPLEGSPLYNRSKERTKYRIAPGLPQNTILMQVIPSNVGKNNGDTDWRTDIKNACYVDGQENKLNSITDFHKSGLNTEQKKPDIYEIGYGKESIRIRTTGMLYFTVNDIALTKRVIKQMQNSSPDYVNKLDINTVKGIWYAKTTAQFDSLFTKKGLHSIKPTFYLKKVSMAHTQRKDSCSSHYITWLKCGETIDTIRRDTVNIEELNIQTFKKLGLVNEDGQPVEGYWNKEKLKDPVVEDMLRCLKDSIYLKTKYSNNAIWKEIPYFDRIELINKSSISTKDSLRVKEFGYKPDSLWNNDYQERMGFHNKVRVFFDIWENAITRDSISSCDSLIRYAINKNNLNLVYTGLFLTKIGLLEKIWAPLELDYYSDTKFVDAWFVDNIGSNMIVIERKKVR